METQSQGQRGFAEKTWYQHAQQIGFWSSSEHCPELHPDEKMGSSQKETVFQTTLQPQTEGENI